MIVQIKSVTQNNSWYSEAVGSRFNVFDVEGGLFYYVDILFPILKSDAKIVSKDPEDFYM